MKNPIGMLIAFSISILSATFPGCILNGSGEDVASTEEHAGIPEKYPTPEDLAKAYFDFACSGGNAAALENCVVDEGTFRKMVPDTVSYYYDFEKNHGDVRYVVYGPTWAKDTVTAAHFELDKDAYTHASGEVYVVDTLADLETVRGVFEKPYHYSIHVEKAHQRAFHDHKSTVGNRETAYHGAAYDYDDLVDGFLESDKVPELKIGVTGARSLSVTWLDEAGNPKQWKIADVIIRVADGWQILLPYGTTGYDTSGIGVHTEAPPQVRKHSHTGIWKTESLLKSETAGSYHLSLDSLNRQGGEFAYIASSKGIRDTLTGTYCTHACYSGVYDPPIVIGEFSYRDPNNPNSWISTEVGCKDTLRQSANIIYSDSLASGIYSAATLFAADTFQYSITIERKTEFRFCGMVQFNWTRDGVADSCGFRVRQYGYEGTSADSLVFDLPGFPEERAAFPQSVVFPPARFVRINSEQ